MPIFSLYTGKINCPKCGKPNAIADGQIKFWYGVAPNTYVKGESINWDPKTGESYKCGTKTDGRIVALEQDLELFHCDNCEYKCKNWGVEIINDTVKGVVFVDEVDQGIITDDTIALMDYDGKWMVINDD